MSCDPVWPHPPEIGIPSLPESSPPTSGSSARSPQTRTATLSTSFWGCMLSVPPRCRCDQTRSNPDLRSLHGSKSTNAPSATHPAHDGVTTPLAPAHRQSSLAYLFFADFPLPFKSQVVTQPLKPCSAHKNEVSVTPYTTGRLDEITKRSLR